MPTVAIDIDLLSKMHAVVESARAHRVARKQTEGDSSDDAVFYMFEAEHEVDLALDEYDRAGAAPQSQTNETTQSISQLEEKGRP